MKTIIIQKLPCCWLVMGLFYTGLGLQAQNNKPNGSTMPSVNPTGIYSPPAYDGGIKTNYIRTMDAQGPFKSINELLTAGRGGMKQTTQYMDGLGRLVQAVSREASPGGKDLIAPVVYDAYGREAYKFMPYVAASADGKFQFDPFTDQAAALGTAYSGESVFYNKINYEASPLNRELKSMPAGNSWAGNDKGMEQQYLINTVADGVRIWNITNNDLAYNNNDVTTNIPTSSSAYAAGELYKTVTKDEGGNAIVEYKDKQGQVVLKKVQAGTIASDYSGYTGFLCTYYIYDDFGLLRFVLPPKAVESVQTDWMLSGQTDIINELCFRYEYDNRQRTIAKKVPGSGWVYMVYDKRDRLAGVQDANMRENNRWTITFYDALNRPVSSGIITYSSGAVALQTYINTKIIISTTTDLPSGNNFIVLSYTYYNNYDWTSYTYSTANNSKLISGDNPYSEGMPAQANDQLKNLVTGTKVRVIADPDDLASGSFITTVNFYDKKGRIIQTRSDNLTTGSYQNLSNLYDFTGKILCSYLEHHNPSATPTMVSLRTDYLYDAGGMLLKTWKTINDDPATKTLIAENEYNELGQLITKKLGQQKNPDNTYSTNHVETLDYTYNVRGWLKGINKDYANGTGDDHWFGMELNYDWGFATNQLNGNIAGTLWRSKGDGEGRAYGYTYDQASRLMSGDFSQYAGSSYADNGTVNFDMKMGDGSDPTSAYDANGNIKRMQQWGIKGLGSAQIDDLAYSYYNNSNKLDHVSDVITGDNKLGDFTDKHSGSYDYGYDKNGNMVSDLNKQIVGSSGLDVTSGGAIGYNHLDLPCLVNVKKDDGTTAKGAIKYIYDAAGNKLQKIVTDQSTAGKTVTTTTSYMAGFVYESKTTIPANTPNDDYADRLQLAPQEEGRIRYTAADITITPNIPESYQFDYFIRDQLGNTRMVLAEAEETSSYPAATLEDSRIAAEEQLYDIATGRIEALPTPVKDDYPSLEEKAYRVRGIEGEKSGLGIVLKVMAGDKIAFKAESYYNPPVGGDVGPTTSLLASELLDAFASGLVAAGKTGIAGTELLSNTDLASAAAGFLTDPDRAPATGVPQAYLNYLLFDEQFNSVGSGFDKIDESGTGYKLHTQFFNTPVDINKSGYIYIYASNESDLKVLFDNLNVTHQKGRMLEETHYYPYGLTMVGISSKALGKMENKTKFQGQELASKEFSDGSGLDMYEFKWRMDDPQTGRFWQIDPLADKYVYNSTYAFSENKVTNHVELEGLESVEAALANMWRSWGITDNKESVRPVMEGAAKAAVNPKTYVEAGVTAGQIAVPVFLTSVFTGGFGTGTVASAEVQALRGATEAAVETPNIAVNVEAPQALTPPTMEAPPSSPNFIVDGGGQVFPVPKNATGPTPVINPGGRQTGVAFTGGNGGANGQVSTMRIMDPVPARGAAPSYPNGYIKYENPAKQGVNPQTGKTSPNADSHYAIRPWEFRAL